MKLNHIALITTLAFSGAAFANDNAHETSKDREAQTLKQVDTEMGSAEGTKERFKQLDKNGDGVLSAGEAEADTQLNAMFLDVDDNDDGQLSSEEFSQWKGGFAD